MNQTQCFFTVISTNRYGVWTFFLGSKRFLFGHYKFKRLTIDPKNLLRKVDAKKSCWVLFRWLRLNFFSIIVSINRHGVSPLCLGAKRFLFWNYWFNSPQFIQSTCSIKFMQHKSCWVLFRWSRLNFSPRRFDSALFWGAKLLVE